MLEASQRKEIKQMSKIKPSDPAAFRKLFNLYGRQKQDTIKEGVMLLVLIVSLEGCTKFSMKDTPDYYWF